MRVELLVVRWSMGMALSWEMARFWGLNGRLWEVLVTSLLGLGLALEWLTEGWQGVAFGGKAVSMAVVMRHAQHHPARLWLGWGRPWRAGDVQRQEEQRAITRPAQYLDQNARFCLKFDQPGNLLVMGAPGSGKTQLFMWLALQAIQRDEVVIFIDPKGGGSIPRMLQAGTARVGKIMYQLRVDDPRQSCQLSLMGPGTEASELATRICRLLPTAEQSTVFVQFSWMALYRILSGILLLGQPLTFGLIRQHLLDQGSRLSRECAVLVGVDHAVVRGLMALARHDADHFGKMVLTMMPLLEVLTSGKLGALLAGPSTLETVTLERVVAQRAVLYVGLGSLQDAQVARTVGALVLGELSRWLGGHYQRAGGQNGIIQVIVDEAAELSGAAFVQLLNKGREAGLQMSLAVQTLADLEVALQGQAEARMMVGNAAHLLAFRTLDPESRRAMIERAGSVRLRVRSSGISMQTSGWLGRRGKSEGVNLQRPWQELPLLTDHQLSELPSLEYVGHFAGQGLVRGRIARLAIPHSAS